MTLLLTACLIHAMPRLEKVLFIVNRNKPSAIGLAGELAGEVERCGGQANISTDYPVDDHLFKDIDLCTVVGGDGTLLGVVHSASERHIPVLGVNLGRLGFIASFTPDNIKDHFGEILSGNYTVRKLSVLTCAGCADSPVVALNDIVVKARSRLVRVEVRCEDEHMNTYHADGIIFSSPTGSTAYNLSAGGPIVHPSARVMVATPINPHTLSNRAIVLDDSHTITVNPLGDPADAQVWADGTELPADVTKFPLRIRIAPDRLLPLVVPTGYSHYFVLRNKLRWTGDAVFSQD